MTPRGYYSAYKGLKILKRRLDLSSDGCSGAPDFDFRQCCVEHDYYYRNPVERTGVSRSAADAKLRRCIAARGRPVLSWAYWVSVRALGWIPWNKAGKAAKEGDTTKINPEMPRHLRHLKGANVFKFTDKEVDFDEY